MKSRIAVKCLMIVLLLSFIATNAGAAAPLTDKQIKNFISSFKEMTVIFDEYDDFDMDDEYFGDSIDNMDKFLSESITRLKGHDAYNRLQRVVRKHGFSNLDEWGQAGDRIFLAMIALQMGTESTEMHEEMAIYMREIEDNPYMSEEQKREMVQGMKNAMTSVMSMINAPEADKNAVRPHMAELEILFAHDDDDDDEYDY